MVLPSDDRFKEVLNAREPLLPEPSLALIGLPDPSILKHRQDRIFQILLLPAHRQTRMLSVSRKRNSSTVGNLSWLQYPPNAGHPLSPHHYKHTLTFSILPPGLVPGLDVARACRSRVLLGNSDISKLQISAAPGLWRCGMTLATGLCLDPRLSFCGVVPALSGMSRLWVPAAALYSNLGELFEPGSSFLPVQPEPPVQAETEAWAAVSPLPPGTLSSESSGLPRRGTDEALLTRVLWGGSWWPWGAKAWEVMDVAGLALS